MGGAAAGGSTGIGIAGAHMMRQQARSSRLSVCPAVLEAALQATCVCCTRLALLELPAHIPANRMPVAPAGAASHLHGLQLLGGLQEGGRWGTRSRRRDGSGAS